MKGYPLGPINKTTFSYSMAQVCRAHVVQAAIGRHQEQPLENEEQYPGLSKNQGHQAKRLTWMEDLKVELSATMQAVMQPTHRVLYDINARPKALETKADQ
ncbi:hypothetical protein CJ030_MR5G020697 [Morella rubra]|uniref:Uncharacterized protein n=1 Tax=Morella rubra TaxID=262757 RepID=A0A6A1VKM0_9ROSI|nr:hypothetical protein CJ030_MR5G020697 [Morella rubra]